MGNFKYEGIVNLFQNGGLSTTNTGKQVLNLSFPISVSVQDGNGEYRDVFPTQWVNLTMWGPDAVCWNEHLNGQKYVNADVSGWITGDIYTAKDGTTKTRLEMPRAKLSLVPPRDNQRTGGGQGNGGGAAPYGGYQQQPAAVGASEDADWANF